MLAEHSPAGGGLNPPLGVGDAALITSPPFSAVLELCKQCSGNRPQGPEKEHVPLELAVT